MKPDSFPAILSLRRLVQNPYYWSEDIDYLGYSPEFRDNTGDKNALRRFPEIAALKIVRQSAQSPFYWIEGGDQEHHRVPVGYNRNCGFAREENMKYRKKNDGEAIRQNIATHNKHVKQRIEQLKTKGARILYADIKGYKKPDIIFSLNGMVIGEDIKTSHDELVGIDRDFEEVA